MTTETILLRQRSASRFAGSVRPLNLDGAAVRSTILAFALSRLLVLAVASVTAAVASFGNRPWLAPIPRPFLHPFGGWPLGGVIDFLVSPLVRGDATYLSAIGYGGYHKPIETSFFPGFPLVVHLLGGFASPAATVLVGTGISLVSFASALYFIHRLAALELGSRAAHATVLLVAFCPAAAFFSAPYTESFFLLSSVVAVYAARTERWAVAAVAGAIAALTRNVGVILVLPLAIMYVRPRLDTAAHSSRRSPWRRPGRRMLWLLLVPVGPIAYSAYLQHAFGDWLMWEHSQVIWGRQSALPWQSVHAGLSVAWHAILGQGHYFGAELVDVAFLGAAALAALATFRRLPIAYGIYSLAVLLPALMDPILGQPPEPLHGLPRYVMVTFPLFMAAGAWLEQRRLTRWAVGASAVGLVGVSAALAAWLPYY